MGGVTKSWSEEKKIAEGRRVERQSKEDKRSPAVCHFVFFAPVSMASKSKIFLACLAKLYGF